MTICIRKSCLITRLWAAATGFESAFPQKWGKLNGALIDIDFIENWRFYDVDIWRRMPSFMLLIEQKNISKVVMETE
jgi:hypothetical protein